MGRFSAIAIVVLLPIAAFAQQGTIDERLARLEEGQKAIHQRIDDVNKRIDDVNKRIDGLRADVNKRFNWLYMLLAAIIALNGAMVGSVVWLARQERPIGHYEYEKLQERDFTLEERLRALERRLQQLEAAKK